MYPSRKSIFKHSFPLILSEISEALMLLTGVVYLSWEAEVYLAAIGMIDAALLFCLAYGFGLTDSFQRYYARLFARENKLIQARQILGGSVIHFLIIALLISGAGTFLVHIMSGIYSNELIDICILAVPYFVALVIVYYLGLPFHAFLVGKGHLRLVGWLACLGVALNAVLIYLFLHVFALEIIPTNAVLLATFCAELVWFMTLFSIAFQKGFFRFALIKIGNRRLYKVLHRAAFYPGLSIMGFHLGSSVLLLYLSYCCAEREVAFLTQVLAYWNMLIAPVNGIADAANNGFSGIYSKRQFLQFPQLKKMYFQVAVAVSSVVFILLVTVNLWVMQSGAHRLSMLLLVGIMSLLGMLNKLDFVALLVRLHNDSFAQVKLLFAASVLLSVVMVDYFFNLEVLILLLFILLAQLILTRWLTDRVRRIWQ